MWVGQSGGGANFDGNQQQVFFNGSASYITSGSGNQIITDEITVDVDPNNAFVISFHSPVGFGEAYSNTIDMIGAVIYQTRNLADVGVTIFPTQTPNGFANQIWNCTAICITSGG